MLPYLETPARNRLHSSALSRSARARGRSLPARAALAVRATRGERGPPGLRELGETCLALSDRKSTRLNPSHVSISYAVFCLKKKKAIKLTDTIRPIDLIMHTPGWLVLPPRQISNALPRSAAKRSRLVPHSPIAGAPSLALSS